MTGPQQQTWCQTTSSQTLSPRFSQVRRGIFSSSCKKTASATERVIGTRMTELSSHNLVSLDGRIQNPD
ncbi:hypothetical protein BV898_18582 [Hypsibius exemplaris]|uniref:Uncharacterized protein n=1 Tax=Hypsibius exemplaris TaxID=2072580 RepID=A0A9X6NI26_HYPEX|nr:hypothetical protein BV898_18582 [Hypsibius exemplaris]